ncbi:unnamed protein product [Urochloa humidicola]
MVDHSWVDTFAVLGSNVIGMGSGLRTTLEHDDSHRGDGDTLAFDTRTAELAFLPDLPNGLNFVRLAVAVGTNRLYVIEDDTWYPGADYYNGAFCRGGLHCLKLAADDGDESWCWHTPASHDNMAPQRRWFWSEGPRMLPLSPDGITAHATDPSGRAFFVSVHGYRYHVGDHRARGTFSYDIEHGFWRRHGGWKLPFVGQAHYHAGMRAWVGLHAHCSNALGGFGFRFRPDGHICASKVPPLKGVAAAPEWKVGKEKLFVKDSRRRWGIVDAKLVDMGGGGRFCLVEILTGPGAGRNRNRKGRAAGEGEKCVLRLSTFRVEYNGDGELVTADRWPAGSFRLSRYHGFSHIYYYCWQAFWA